jgi:hypothetical protein
MKPFTKPCRLLVVLTFVISFSPTSSWADNSQGLAKALEAQKRHTEVLMNLPGVVGTAVSWTEDGTPMVKIYTEKMGIGGLPKQLDGVPVAIEVTGRIHALAAPPCKGPNAGDPGCPGSGGGTDVDPKAKWSSLPVPIGVSAGNMESIRPSGLLVTCNTGTLGARVKNSSTNKLFILSNNHVLALSNQATTGDLIVQPGPADADPVCTTNAESYNEIGLLADFQPINFDGTTPNLIDAAIAGVSSITVGAGTGTPSVGTETPSDGYGIPQSTSLTCFPENLPEADCSTLSDKAVQKYGRTTGLTKGKITGINVTVAVDYTAGTAIFEHQIEVSAAGKRGGFIKSGDSGSLLVTDPGKQPVGLLFAGDNRGKFGFANRIDLVLDHFSIVIDGE